jgi:hypothetical protein
MARSYSHGSLVRLPRLTAVSAARLLRELISAAEAEKKKLPAVIASLRDALVAAYDPLEVELGKRVSGVGEEPPVVAAADRVEDNAFGALYDWLSSIVRLPADRHPESAQAQAVLDGVFSGGLEFLKARPANEWQEAEVRLKLIADGGHKSAIEKLGGKPFLDELDVAHKAYGEALGITAAKAAPESPAIREALEAAIDETRAYVIGVVAQIKKKDPETAALAERLLAPLTNWKESAAKGGGAAAQAPAQGAQAPAAQVQAQQAPPPASPDAAAPFAKPTTK